jgi:hypothetical protein
LQSYVVFSTSNVPDGLGKTANVPVADHKLALLFGGHGLLKKAHRAVAARVGLGLAPK